VPAAGPASRSLSGKLRRFVSQLFGRLPHIQSLLWIIGVLVVFVPLRVARYRRLSR